MLEDTPAAAPQTPPAHAWGVGMPAFLHLHEFGRLVFLAFGEYPLLVGSALTTKTPRDIDVRLVLPMDVYQQVVGPARECGVPGTRWSAFCVAFSALAAQMTGTVVDFQIQTPGHANVYMDEQRLPLGYAVGRFTMAVQP